MSKDALRATRLHQIQIYLYKYPQGLTTRELASLCDTTIRTIQRDLQVLSGEMHIPIQNKGQNRYGLMTEFVLPPVAFSLYEAIVLFLAARLIVRQTDDHNPYIQNAITRIISLMPKPLAAQLAHSVRTLNLKPGRTSELAVFENVSRAWVNRKRLKITYDSYSRHQVEEWLVDPYFIEMTGVGFSIYLIGYVNNEGARKLQTFKLNRIRRAEVIEQQFEVDSTLKLDDLLSSAWGVMWGEKVPVKLKFSAAVVRRVKETFWHPSQQIEDLPDGGCLMTVQVSSTLEMSPWIKGWGPDVEVLEPDSLRNDFKGWAERLNNMYNKI